MAWPLRFSHALQMVPYVASPTFPDSFPDSQVLGLSADVTIEYKAHNASLRDKTSFRNTSVYK